MNVLYPPQIEAKSYQIKIKLFRGEQLKKMDTYGHCDPYVKVDYSGLSIVSTTLKIQMNPVWNEEILVRKGF